MKGNNEIKTLEHSSYHEAMIRYTTNGLVSDNTSPKKTIVLFWIFRIIDFE